MKVDPGIALPGPFRAEALSVFQALLDENVSWLQSYAVACWASYGAESFAHQRTIAEFIGSCVRTVQRGTAAAKELGIMATKWISPGTRPQAAKHFFPRGGAIRRIIGWGLPRARALARQAQARIKRIWRNQAVERKRERERAEIDRAVAEFRAQAPP